MNTPAYKLADFVQGCRNGEARVLATAERTMAELNIHSKKALTDFIGDGGLENPEFIRSDDWEKNPDPAVPIKVDSYNFNSGPTLYGYIAFMFQPKTTNWLIKSFKRNDRSDPKPHAMYEAFKKAGLLK